VYEEAVVDDTAIKGERWTKRLRIILQLSKIELMNYSRNQVCNEVMSNRGALSENFLTDPLQDLEFEVGRKLVILKSSCILKKRPLLSKIYHMS
jgi:hypothetical protein